ncbi:MAG: steroid 5-alpha reductase, partial [Chloroflexi bacterium]|nr:steroid 5-alpha reductase [Chloroflexota bacterium]
MHTHLFPDRRWDEPVKVPYAIGLFSTLALYWIAPWLIVSRAVAAPDWYLALCISVFTFGIF